MKKIVLINNFKLIALPIRSTLKHKFPLIPMEEYILWKNDKDKAFDPCIRVYVKQGGSIVNVCNNSMEIKGKVGE